MVIKLEITVPATFGGDWESSPGEMYRTIELFEPPYIGMKLLFPEMRCYREDKGPISIMDVAYDADRNTYVAITSKISIPGRYVDQCKGWKHKFLNNESALAL